MPVLMAALLAAAFAASCDDAQAPELSGEVVLHFDPATKALPAGANTRASIFDSVVVNVFRSGATPSLEVSRGAAITSDNPINLVVGCIAENHKHVSVDLYVNRALAYTGADADVNVTAGKTTPVSIDAYAFFVSNLTVTPQVIPSGAAFTVHWPGTPGASGYHLEESATPDFAQIAATESVTDTTIDVHLAMGAHYFRVRPVTPYASGNSSPERFGYVTGGGNKTKITSADAAAIPGETITIKGENLDFPATQFVIGTRQMIVESASWAQVVARVPRYATTAKVTATSTLGVGTSPAVVVVQRVAYVTSGGEFASSYMDVLSHYDSDFGLSGIVSIPVTDLDTRDMSVFDIIIVANDTGDAPIRWAGKPARYSAITTSGAGVLAIGQGGASFMRLASSALTTVTTTSVSLANYYTDTPGSAIFTTPHSVSNGALPQTIAFCPNQENTVAFSVTGAQPASSTKYAETAVLSGKWVIADFQVATLRYVFFGFAADPSKLAGKGKDFLGNAMNLLYTDRPPLPPDPAIVAHGR